MHKKGFSSKREYLQSFPFDFCVSLEQAADDLFENVRNPSAIPRVSLKSIQIDL